MAEATLVNQINDKLNSLSEKAGKLHGLSEQNNNLVSQQGELWQTITTIGGRIKELYNGIQKITNGKKQLEDVVRQTNNKLEGLEDRFTETISQIDVKPLLQQLKPLSDELDRIATLIQESSTPAGTPADTPADTAADPDQAGGYVIPKHKKRNYSSKRKRTYKKKGGSKSKVRKTKRKN